jgi:UDP-N-acetyl-D-mannosaminuronic acid dehydrogenase
MQLSAFSKDQFSLGLAAVWVNEGLPRFLVDQLAKQCDISKATVGILGMAFKADSDDIRDSLSYKLKKLVQLEAARTLCHDPFVRDETFTPVPDLIRESDAIVLATPHSEYKNLRIPPEKVVIDVWGYWQNRAGAQNAGRS